MCRTCITGRLVTSMQTSAVKSVLCPRSNPDTNLMSDSRYGPEEWGHARVDPVAGGAGVVGRLRGASRAGYREERQHVRGEHPGDLLVREHRSDRVRKRAFVLHRVPDFPKGTALFAQELLADAGAVAGLDGDPLPRLVRAPSGMEKPA